MCIYETWILIKRIHYVVYYFLIGTLVFLIEEALLSALGDSSWLSYRVLIIYGSFAIFPIVPIYLSHRFRSTLRRTKSFLIPPQVNDHDSWVLKNTSDFFSLNLWSTRVFVLILGTALFATISSFSKPYASMGPNAIVFITMLPGIFIGSHGVCFVFRILYFLPQFVRYPLNAPFFMIHNDELKYIQGFYFGTAVLLLFCYLISILIVLASPFSYSGPVLFWLSFLGFCPLALFLWSYWQVHVLMVRMKQISVNICSSKLQIALNELDKYFDAERVDKLLKLMEAQSRVEKLADWPINISSSITFFVTLILPVASFGFDIFKIR